MVQKGRIVTEAEVTISRMYYCGEDVINIRVEDSKSGEEIVSLYMDLESFAESITGFSMRPARVEKVIDERDRYKIGKKIELKTLTLPRRYMSADKENIRIDTIKEMQKRGIDGSEWEIKSDGTHIKQNAGEHKVTIARWVEE